MSKENAFEVLLIDDGSTDDSGKFDEYSQKMLELRVFTFLMGVSKARNYGISKAKRAVYFICRQ